MMALKPVKKQKTKNQPLHWPMETSRVILYLLPSEKLNQIRKKAKEREEILLNGNYYDLKGCIEMPSFNSVTKPILE